MNKTSPDQRIEINVLGVDLAFRFQAERGRIDYAKAFIEKEYNKLKNRGRQLSDEQLLMMLIMGIADDLLQSQQYIQEINERLEHLLSCIDKAENLTP